MRQAEQLSCNLVSLYLAKQIVNGHKNLAHAQQEYVVLIPTLSKEAKNNQEEHQTRGGKKNTI